MPTFEDAVADAEEAQQAIRGLAHAMQRVDDPAHGYPVLGSLTSGVSSLEFVLTQMARFYETTASDRAMVREDRGTGRAAAQRAAGHLRDAAVLVARATESIACAHNADSEITYVPPSVLVVPRHAARGKRALVAGASALASQSLTPVRTVEVDGPSL